MMDKLQQYILDAEGRPFTNRNEQPMTYRSATIERDGLEIDIRWEYPHTVNSYIADVPIGSCAIGSFEDDAATESDWYELLDELEECEWHPLLDN